MKITKFVGSLTRSGKALADMYDGIPEAALRRRPAPERWSPLEILCHLVDEERDDFRARIQSTLEDSGAEWAGIDPAAWVTERAYNEKDPQVALTSFRMERAESLAWLVGLEAGGLDRVYRHPLIGDLSVGDLLAAWAAHDLLHLRQLCNTLLDVMDEDVAPFSTRYAMP
jgi:hypothetical protein